jgi:hypothetical protein
MERPKQNTNTEIRLKPVGIMVDNIKTKYYWKVVLLKDRNVVHDEVVTFSKWKARLIGWIWKYIPDLTFINRNYIIVCVD